MTFVKKQVTPSVHQVLKSGVWNEVIHFTEKRKTALKCNFQFWKCPVKGTWRGIEKQMVDHGKERVRRKGERGISVGRVVRR